MFRSTNQIAIALPALVLLSFAAPQSRNAGHAVPPRRTANATGTVVGRVLFDGKGVRNIEVVLAENVRSKVFDNIPSLSEPLFSGRRYDTRTDSSGRYVFQHVTPGSYSVAARLLDSDQYLVNVSGFIEDAEKFRVAAHRTVRQPDLNLYKLNLEIMSPDQDATVSDRRPTLKWKAYPHAAYYQVDLHTLKNSYDNLLSSSRADRNYEVVRRPLADGEYGWSVSAYNANDVKIAMSKDGSSFTVAANSGSHP